jgi:hypothetical protein
MRSSCCGQHDDLAGVTDFENTSAATSGARIGVAGVATCRYSAIDGSRVRIDPSLQRAIVTVPAPAL